MNLLQQLELLFSRALADAGASAGYPAIVRPGSRPAFGDYQVNGVMSAAKNMGIAPRDFADRVIQCVGDDDRIERLEIAGPGFINIFMENAWIADTITTCSLDPGCGVERAENQETIVIDYSHPNVAKDMAVHHIRSTVIGDSIVRIYDFLGHNVIRQNHIGDWGTQFGMLIGYLEELENSNKNTQTATLTDFEGFYKEAKKRFDSDELFADNARKYVVKLQQNDPECMHMWEKLVNITMQQNQRLYERLHVLLTPEDTMGESAYNDFLPHIVHELQARDLLREHEGAKVVYLNEYTNKNGDPMGVIIQKNDGGFLYTTTDLAAIHYRAKNLHANRIIYCVDARQSQHLQQVFAIAYKAGFATQEIRMEHYAFGMMLGKDGKPYKTRTGETIKLSDLLDEAELRVANLLAERNSTLTEEEKVNVIDALAVGSIKYADLSKNRTSNYIFDWNQMLSFDGNTAPYILYAYTRIQSIFRKANMQSTDINYKVILTENQERTLALKLLQFGDTVYHTAKEGMPHLLCTYLFDMAGEFMSFYEHCPVNRKEVPVNIRHSRLQLCLLTAKILKTGLSLLGIKTVEKM